MVVGSFKELLNLIILYRMGSTNHRKGPKRAEKDRKEPKRTEKDQKELDKKSRKGPKRTG